MSGQLGGDAGVNLGSSSGARANIVLGVAGGIAAYKAVELLRLLTEAGHAVTVVPTRSALEFVGEATWQALSGRPVATEVFTNTERVSHVQLGQQADLIVVAPATANTLARAAAGLADDLLTNTLLMARCPVVFAPAMHTEMWRHPATVANVATLTERGAVFLGPDSGRLTGSDSGPGRLVEPEDLAWEIFRLLRRRANGPHAIDRDLAGRRVVVSAGGTREFLDPVRFIGNRSSGRQGYALARTAAARGAEVTLVSANSALPDPREVTVVPVTTTEQLRQAVFSAARGPERTADVVIMAAAPADFQPVETVEYKIKKTTDGAAPTIALRQTPDILRELADNRADGQLIVGFAAETGDAGNDVLGYAKRKLAAKGCDLLVVNDVSEGRAFESVENSVTVLSAAGSVTEFPLSPKDAIADLIWDTVVSEWNSLRG